jgi:hypothetical protein
MEPQRVRSGFWWIATASTAGVLIVWGVLAWYASIQAKPGDFGDSFGISSSLFSGLAFAILIATLYAQREELALQRQELTETREVFTREQFESTFFQLVGMHEKVTNGMALRADGSEERRGRACFPELLRRLDEVYHRGGFPETDEERRVIAVFAAFYQEFEYMLGPYFRVLYNVIRYVDEARIADKKIYANLVRAQLSSHELALLYYSVAFHPHGVGMRKYVGRYKLLKHLPMEKLLSPSHAQWLPTANKVDAVTRAS